MLPAGQSGVKLCYLQLPCFWCTCRPGLRAMGALFVADGLLHRAVDNLPPVRCHARDRLRSPNVILRKMCTIQYAYSSRQGRSRFTKVTHIGQRRDLSCAQRLDV